MKLSTMTLAAAIAVSALAMTGPPANAQEAYIGEIKPVGFTFCPRGWAEADGSLLPIAQHQSLFQLLGTTYGGDGRTTFGLPDLRGRVAMGQGQGHSLRPRQMGQQLGQEQAGAVKKTDRDRAFTPPVLVVRYCIALEGIFPSRN